MTLPTFLVIGAARSGTTSLYHYLGQHPEVFMSPVKEPWYFDHIGGRGPDRADPNYGFLISHAVNRREDYEALFARAGDAKARGEASPSYLRNPAVPARVRRLLPDVRLVAILRDPAERAYASFLGSKRAGLAGVPATFEEALRDEERGRGAGPYLGYVAFGRYREQLSRWYALFDREQVRVYLHDDLGADAAALMADLFGFVGVDPGVRVDTSERLNPTGRIANPALRPVWERSGGARRLVRPLVPEALRDRAYARVTRDVVRPPMAEETGARLRERFRPEVLALEELIGRDLSAWL